MAMAEAKREVFEYRSGAYSKYVSIGTETTEPLQPSPQPFSPLIPCPHSLESYQRRLD
jgi:hypothetical protein